MLVHVRVLTETVEDVERKFEGMYRMPATVEELRKEIAGLHGEITSLGHVLQSVAAMMVSSPGRLAGPPPESASSRGSPSAGHSSNMPMSSTRLERESRARCQSTGAARPSSQDAWWGGGRSPSCATWDVSSSASRIPGRSGGEVCAFFAWYPIMFAEAAHVGHRSIHSPVQRGLASGSVGELVGFRVSLPRSLC